MKKFATYCVLCIITLTAFCGFAVKPVLPVAAHADGFSLKAKSAFLMEYCSGEVLYAQNAEAKLPVASMVKLMTLLLVFEDIDAGKLSLTDKIVTSENASGMGGSQVFIDPFVSYKAEDLIKSVVMASANDASVALAEHLNGTEAAFVNRMNSRAKELGMNGTVYKNCTGLPAPEQYSTAKDSAVLLRELFGHDEYHAYSTIWMDELVHPSGRKTELVNTNKLIRYFNGCDGGKTGSTTEAGYCLSATAKKDDMRLVSVVIGSESGKERFAESTALLNYGFTNFENKHLIKCGDEFGKIIIKKGKLGEISAVAGEDFYAISKKGDTSAFEIKVELTESIKAPMEAGEVVGKIYVTKNQNVVKEINVVLAENVEAITFKDGFKKIVSNW